MTQLKYNNTELIQLAKEQCNTCDAFINTSTALIQKVATQRDEASYNDDITAVCDNLLMPFCLLGTQVTDQGTPLLSVWGHFLHLSPGVSHLICISFSVSLSSVSWYSSSHVVVSGGFLSERTRSLKGYH